ncbi:MAG: replication initiation factor domain-containing protein [Chloroflexota bacterium]
MRIHWFSFTVFSDVEHGRKLWKRHFFHSLGALVSTERKGRGFEAIDVALKEAKFYHTPTQPKNEDGSPKSEKQAEYYNFEIPGEACDCLVPTVFRDVTEDLKSSGLRWQVKRIDIAWDGVPFTPVMFCQAIMWGNAVTLAKRESLSIVQAPFELREDGQMGCDTCYLGDKSSMRFVRVYNKRGPVRLEFVCKDERAHVVALDIFQHLYGDWDLVAREHLTQYIRFTEEFPEWHEFIDGAKSADIKISAARVTSLARGESWIEKQVAVFLSVHEDVWGRKQSRDRIEKLVSHARATRDRSRYSAVLQLANAGGML